MKYELHYEFVVLGRSSVSIEWLEADSDEEAIRKVEKKLLYHLSMEHLTGNEDAEVSDQIMLLQTGKKIELPDRFCQSINERSADHHKAYIRSRLPK